ncbi:bacteriocin fulvocin C-related protein [Streptosporangium sp. NPDC050280]|uniref:bacteriocin fulvocin C-related protein n=1 Tax=unclassified Streptosporangium TaxID=2632669 RepID=UPI00341D151E
MLAFDASCGQCHKISRAIARESGDKVEILGLRDPDVRQWRKLSLGEEAPWAPTLIRIRDSAVHAWTGPAMGLRLAYILGPGKTIILLRTIGELRNLAKGQVPEAGGYSMGRAQFLRLSAGLGVAAAFLITGNIPAFADSEPEVARTWVEANKDRLPKSYAEFAAYSMAYRKAIYAELSSETRSRFWVEHVESYRAAHSGLSPEQHEVINKAVELFSDESKFLPGGADSSRESIATLEKAAKDAFGFGEARALIATLGPPEEASRTAVEDCDCNVADEWCWFGECYARPCGWWYSGCGTGYFKPCDGLC